MAITYTWTIPVVERIVETGGIKIIHWRCKAVDGDDVAIEGDTVSCTPDPSASDFIAYDSVTEADCIAWVQADVGKDTIETTLATQINLLKTPTQAAGVPW